MIAKIVKGRGFGGVVRYIFDAKKEAELLDSDGLRLKDLDSIVHSFMAQQELNPRVSKPVCHVSLSFSVEDNDKLSSEMMVKIARDYMEKMGISNTQYIIGRHYDKEHQHLHLVYNRVDNNGKTITDKNDRFRSEKICKELTTKYGLYFATGKENVKRHRLKEPDKTKYEIYDTLKRQVPQAKSWQDLINRLRKENISVEFKMRSGTNEPQGVKFSKNGYSFNGSKIDREFSFTKIDKQIEQNSQIHQPQEQTQQQQYTSDSSSGSLFGGLLGGFNNNPAVDMEEENFRKAMQRRKKKGLRR